MNSTKMALCVFLLTSLAHADALPPCDSWLQNPTPSVTVQRLHEAGVLIEPRRRMRAEGYKWEHEIRIALPSSYRKENRTYSVLWVTDGHAFFEPAVGFATACAQKYIPEMIVVGIGAPPQASNESHMRRTYDFTPNDVKSYSGFGSKLVEEQMKARDEKRKAEGTILAKDWGGAPRFLAFLADTVRPLLARDYRMADDHTLFGDSAGGLFCTYALLARYADS